MAAPFEMTIEYLLVIEPCKLTAETIITGTRELGYTLGIEIRVTSTRTVDAVGRLTLNITIGDSVTVLDTNLPVTIPAEGMWNKLYSWKPAVAGTHTLHGLFTQP